MKNLTVVTGKVFVSSMQRLSCQRENCLLTTKFRETERGGSMEEQKKKRGQPWDGCSLPSWKPFSFFEFRQLHNRTFPWPVFMPILKYDFHYMLELNNIHKHKCLHSFTSGLNFKLPKWKSVSLFNLVRFFKMILAGFAEDWFYRLCLHSRTGRVSQIKEGVEEKLFLWQT